ncbi:GNAT family N-acetyltransferase [Paralcaligenes sp. KSB-10]|uniref:GNAT family N-acetyltransferase n=1 Tax=Paralcaligenes sp. KSB-10 TaxID=2901142 RepID=UPI00351CFBF2
MIEQITLVLGNWETYQEPAMEVRYEVFVQEQHVPVEEERDQEDAHCVHAVAFGRDGRPVGTGRLLRNAHIGRMAVRATHRGLGVGSRLLTALVDEARRRQYPEVVLSAQVHARAFYEAHGFVAQGETYIEAGIEHITMRRILIAA